MRITFAKQWVKVSVKYACKCGHNFTRLNTDWFTITSFNTDTPENIREEMLKTQRERKRVCPKCKKIVRPVLTALSNTNTKQP